ncbi:AzlD domain-containing protein [Texcoconibacillus texcoconensis]|uniref:Branched-subunit amino acid transport protein n=1 Tax=Texcoconibacillus texcoconensis TaxID=1095777 RepID=A0A840QS45_9BACI|nr:AzlD domain-containing protein [Texcoconibacillus texcoconensis]MBB5174326.1 branched-subunit amino acid transport protein [Texcoconibacillus texcoconensis]
MNLFWIIIGMGIVTYIPRMIPLVTMSTENWPAWLKRMLQRVPYAILGALIFPGILEAHEQPILAVFAGIIAIALAYIGVHMIGVVLGGIVSLYFLQMMF